jgi:NADH-quinone oxidoreductase subunit N
MDITSFYESLAFIKPEIAISVTLLLIVIFDLIYKDNKKAIPFIAAAGLIATLSILVSDLYLTGFAFTISDSFGSFGMVTVDSFGTYFKVLISICSLLILYFSEASSEIQKTSDRKGEYYTLIFGMILGMFLLVSASDLILIYLSLELMSLSSYVLAGFTKLRDRSSEAALKYILYGATASGLMLFGISLIYGITGTTNLLAINAFLQSAQIDLMVLSFSLILLFAGIGYKISAVPFHFWTPDVYEGAPIPITAFLSVASKAAGFALLIRVVRTSFVLLLDSKGHWEMIDVFDWQAFIILIAIMTMTLGNLSALWQDNLKRMLAYSSIAHAGYLLLGLATLSNQGIIAVLIYFFIYMLMNLGAFFVVMVIANKTGSENIEDYNGLGYKAPFLGVAFVVFLISLIGLPPTAGFIGKLYLFIALVDANLITVAIVALLNTVVSLYYYVRVIKHMYLTDPTSETPEIPLSRMNFIFVLILVVPTFVLGLYFTPLVSWAKNCITILGN